MASSGPRLDHHPARPAATGSTFVQRLMYYAFGIAIGCVLVGAMMSARAKSARNQMALEQQRAIEAARAAAEKAGEGGGPSMGPAPTRAPVPPAGPAAP